MLDQTLVELAKDGVAHYLLDHFHYEVMEQDVAVLESQRDIQVQLPLNQFSASELDNRFWMDLFAEMQCNEPELDLLEWSFIKETQHDNQQLVLHIRAQNADQLDLGVRALSQLGADTSAFTDFLSTL
jgi:hypothetical protein